MTYISKSVEASIYKLTQEAGTYTLRFYVYDQEQKTIPYDHVLDNDELFNIMVDLGRVWQAEQNSEEE